MARMPPLAPSGPAEDGSGQRTWLRPGELCWQRVNTSHPRGGGEEPGMGTGGPRPHWPQELGDSFPTGSFPPASCFPVPSRAPGLARCHWGWPVGFGCREIAAYLGEELKKYVPKGYRITCLKHCVLQKVHQGDVRVINDNFISSRLYGWVFFPFTQDFDPPCHAGYCVCCQGQISSCSEST